MGKSAILKKIHNAAKNYQRYLAGKTFMYVYEGKSIEVVFKNSSFLHLTGVNTKLKAKEFYKHAKTKNLNCDHLSCRLCQILRHRTDSRSDLQYHIILRDIRRLYDLI